jgi:hypothetical protein
MAADEAEAEVGFGLPQHRPAGRPVREDEHGRVSRKRGDVVAAREERRPLNRGLPGGELEVRKRRHDPTGDKRPSADRTAVGERQRDQQAGEEGRVERQAHRQRRTDERQSREDRPGADADDETGDLDPRAEGEQGRRQQEPY